MSGELPLVRRAYGDAARLWAEGAELAYGPMAAALLERAPRPLAGATILDVGSGTGAVARLARDAGAAPVAVDATLAMLAYRAATRPPAAVADIARLPLRSGCVDGAVAAFVLNHLADPVAGLREFGRVVRPGGFVLASTFSAVDRSPVKTIIDDTLKAAGWRPPEWYRHLKAFESILGSGPAMRDAARRAGLGGIEVDEPTIETGLTDPVDIVRYRFSQPHVAGFVATLTPAAARSVADACVAALAAQRTALSITTVFLAASVRPMPAERRTNSSGASRTSFVQPGPAEHI